ncbi:MAG: GTPase HflX [Firmicutes bacterium]|nr:GTPase HflX [Bacillota bacterium]
MEELAQLSYTAGADVVAQIIQKKEKVDPAYFIGRGKAEELSLLCRKLEANLVIFLEDLRPVQERNLTELLNVKVIDRQALILDIFAQRALTKEGKLQVELAQLEYLLPRLTGYGIILSRLGGGIGTRGPGETKLETDRRHIRRRISTLKRENEKVRAHRELLRESRYHRGFKLAALVGYTNTGKSTLLNALTGAHAFVEDKLFATLDPTVKKVYLGEGKYILLIDTVGFIKNLPHQLVVAFKATLEEVRQADLILNVMDASHPKLEEHLEIVDQVLEELAADNKPMINILNKIDKVSDKMKIKELLESIPDSVAISALDKSGFTELFKRISSVFEQVW